MMMIMGMILFSILAFWLVLVSFSSTCLAFYNSRNAKYERKLSEANAQVSDLQDQKGQLQRMITEFETMAGLLPVEAGR